MSKNIKVENFFENNLIIFFVILLCLTIAHFPVLSGDFLRQDDWNATFWSRGGFFFLPWGHPEWWNAAIELFRPVGAIILIISDFISIKIENAKFVKFFTILMMSFAAYLTYKWQNKFNSNNKFFSLAFSILSFCLIASQLQTATAGYNGMVITLLCGQIALIYFYKALKEVEENFLKRKYIIISGFLILAGSMNYAISMMFYFLFLFIFFILTLDNKSFSKKEIYEFLIKSSIFIISIMILYVLMAKSFHYVLGVEEKMHGGYVRSIHIDWDIMNKIYNILAMLKYSFNTFNLWSSWGVKDVNIFFTVAPLTLILFFISIYIKSYLYNKHSNNLVSYVAIFSNTTIVFLVSFILLILSYTPVLPLKVVVYDENPFAIIMTNRYFVVTMPFILYIMMWSINTIGSLKFLSSFNYIYKNLILIIILIFGIYQCNFSLKNYIVHPHLTELNFIRKHIEQDVLKIIESGEKPSILIIRNPSIKENNQGNDYDLTINFSHNWLVSATIYALRQYDIWTIITHRVIEWDNSKGIHIVSIWGELASVEDRNTFNFLAKKNTVIIDMNKLTISDNNLKKLIQF